MRRLRQFTFACAALGAVAMAVPAWAQDVPAAGASPRIDAIKKSGA